MATALTTIALRHDLTDRLAASSVRLANYERRLLAGTSALRPIDFDRLLDDYRAEIIRHDRISCELKSLDEPTKAEKYLHKQRVQSKQQRERIKY